MTPVKEPPDVIENEPLQLTDYGNDVRQVRQTDSTQPPGCKNGSAGRFFYAKAAQQLPSSKRYPYRRFNFSLAYLRGPVPKGWDAHPDGDPVASGTDALTPL